MFLFQKNSASLNLASITLSFPDLISPFLSFASEITKNKFVKFSFLSKVGIYFWCDCIVIINISLGMFRNFLSNSQINTFGFSTIFVISFNKLSLVFIKIFLLFDNFSNSEFMKSFLFSWSIITPLVLKNFKYWSKLLNDLVFSSISFSIKVRLELFRCLKSNSSFFPSNIDKIDFNGLPQRRVCSPHFIDFSHVILNRM